jgi:hypothetical protein
MDYVDWMWQWSRETGSSNLGALQRLLPKHHLLRPPTLLSLLTKHHYINLVTARQNNVQRLIIIAVLGDLSRPKL